MGVQKTILRHGRTLEHGTFDARETVYACMNKCRWPSGLQVVQRADSLAERLLPRSAVGYDVLVFIGMERFVRFRQRGEIQTMLMDRFGLPLSTGEISRLGRLFLEYLERLHEARAGDLRCAMEEDGGWPLHLDATGEGGRGTLLVAFSGWRRWALGAWKIPTENADAIQPHLHTVIERFGPPCAIMRDLGVATTKAAAGLVKEHHLQIPIIACHSHFLKDVGTDLLEPSHAQMRALFRQYGVNTKLRSLARDLGRRIGQGMEQARLDLAAWQLAEDQGHIVPEGRAGLATVRAFAQWVFDHLADGSGQGFPFDRPYLDLHNRCAQASRAIDAFLRHPPHDRVVLKALKHLHAILKPVVCDAAMAQAARTLVHRAALFDELRDALRLLPKIPPGAPRASTIKDIAELRDVRKAVGDLTESLRNRRPKRGPAKDQRQAIDIVLRHLDAHGGNLWGHEVKIVRAQGQIIRLVDRTNNSLEGFFHGMKHGERRRSGRKNLTRDFEDLPAAAALAQNLNRPDYVTILCGDLDNLPRVFARLDAEKRQQGLRVESQPEAASGKSSALPESASLPRDDLRLVRTEAMDRKMHDAASSRSPRFPVQPTIQASRTIDNRRLTL
jgi:hypothetical protein